jgi:hypothetical protein
MIPFDPDIWRADPERVCGPLFCDVFLLYFTLCCPFAADAIWLFVAEVLTDPLPPGLAGLFVGALEGLPG